MADVYDGILRTILHDCKAFVLPLLNEVFDENYTGDEEILFHPNEHFPDNQDGPDLSMESLKEIAKKLGKTLE